MSDRKSIFSSISASVANKRKCKNCPIRDDKEHFVKGLCYNCYRRFEYQWRSRKLECTLDEFIDAQLIALELMKSER